MYINFKSKYKKILWFIFGFIIACSFINKVHAYTFPNGSEFTQESISSLWNTYLANTTPHDIKSSCSLSDDTCSHTFSESSTPFNFVLISQWNSSSDRYQILFFRSLEEVNVVVRSTGVSFNINKNAVQTQSGYNDIKYAYYPFLEVNYTTNTVTLSDSSYDTSFSNYSTTNYNGIGNFKHFALNFNLYNNDTLLKDKNLDYSLVSSPDYLNGYTKITLTTEDKYYMLSGLNEGSVFIPIEDFNSSGGRLSYYDNDLSSQPYTSYIQDYTITSDGLYARQDFNLNNYYGADFVMFSKYIYLEGEDNLTYDIWVPEDITYSDVTITLNSSGGNNFDFQYKDSNGDIQNAQVISVDLSQNNPLLGNIFSDFSSNTFGLTSIVTAPLSLISSLSSTSCSNLIVPLPYISSNLTLPCMSIIYSNTFGSFFTLYQTITTGIISYWVIVKIFNLVKDFKNPDHDEIEVIDL